jgi:uncharacterized membrane protein (Fun14 family)
MMDYGEPSERRSPLFKRIRNTSEKPVRPKELLRKGRSPLSAKSVWLATGLLIGGSTMASGPSNSTLASWLQGQAPAVMTISGSYLAGFFIGWGARRTIRLTSIITGIALAIIGLLVSWGWDGTTVQSWVNSANAWVGESIEGAGRYLVSMLPSATAAGAGGVLGFRRK